MTTLPSDGPLSRLVWAALDWQEAVDLITACAPLPKEHPDWQPMVERATEAHLILLHAARDCRAMLDAIGNGS